jgi:hypothetical protein
MCCNDLLSVHTSNTVMLVNPITNPNPMFDMKTKLVYSSNTQQDAFLKD